MIHLIIKDDTFYKKIQFIFEQENQCDIYQVRQIEAVTDLLSMDSNDAIYQYNCQFSINNFINLSIVYFV